jgi:hypothetical protein
MNGRVQMRNIHTDVGLAAGTACTPMSVPSGPSSPPAGIDSRCSAERISGQANFFKSFNTITSQGFNMPSISTKRALSQTRLAAAAALLLLGGAATSVHAQVLADTGFGGPLVPFSTVLGNNSTQMVPGVWGHEVSTITGTVGTVSPNGGTTMLSMSPGGGVTTQAGQAINLTSYGGLIASGANATFGAYFNAAQTGPSGGVFVSFFATPFYSSLISSVGFASAVNNNPGDWQQFQVVAPIPMGTTWMLAQVYYSNPTMSIVNGQTQNGFVDDAYFSVTAVPEPASWALMGLGALGIAWRQRASASQRA